MIATSHLDFFPEASQSLFCLPSLKKIKKREIVLLGCLFSYAFFRSSSKPTTATAMIIAITAPVMYNSRSELVTMFDTLGVVVGAADGWTLA
jgi:hypothetical protein